MFIVQAADSFLLLAGQWSWRASAFRHHIPTVGHGKQFACSSLSKDQTLTSTDHLSR
jgi:hypothetical protein